MINLILFFLVIQKRCSFTTHLHILWNRFQLSQKQKAVCRAVVGICTLTRECLQNVLYEWTCYYIYCILFIASLIYTSILYHDIHAWERRDDIREHFLALNSYIIYDIICLKNLNTNIFSKYLYYMIYVELFVYKYVLFSICYMCVCDVFYTKFRK